MPYFLLTAVVLGVAVRGTELPTHLGRQLLAYALALPLVAATGLFPLVRPLSAGAARALCSVESGELAEGPPASWAARRRTAAWFTLHAGIGALVSGLTLAVPPLAAVLLALPFSARLRESALGEAALPYAFGSAGAAPAVGLALLAALPALAAAAGALLARLAPALLGPAPADRLAAAEARAADLAARNRLARELHDSVGHALGAVTLQAAAARRVLESDREFARGALAAIEDTARNAVAELDAVLGLLRAEDPASADQRAPAPTLEADLDALLARSRAAGLDVRCDGRPPAPLPPVISREGYRIVQEGLANALRHAGPPPVRLRLRIALETPGPARQELVLTMDNALPPHGGSDGGRRGGGGRGLRGVAERAALLGGRARWGVPAGDPAVWRLTARLPLPVGRPA
ncbi:histidine kinase [Streptomyces sp. DSM 44917]|uniref:histidine kinase n=1 Tax=Streptomyces boetiae TaxID=3075541 RepID=A0ABU2L5W5_9ACTN|nr:histidine kinase [Streptomyces sp. DSM 44917]MDT0306757.1 histidine kinase [Streptomyces sp. DSM 44917]